MYLLLQNLQRLLVFGILIKQENTKCCSKMTTLLFLLGVYTLLGALAFHSGVSSSLGMFWAKLLKTFETAWPHQNDKKFDLDYIWTDHCYDRARHQNDECVAWTFKPIIKDFALITVMCSLRTTGNFFLHPPFSRLRKVFGRIFTLMQLQKHAITETYACQNMLRKTATCSETIGEKKEKKINFWIDFFMPLHFNISDIHLKKVFFLQSKFPVKITDLNKLFSLELRERTIGRIVLWKSTAWWEMVGEQK